MDDPIAFMTMSRIVRPYKIPYSTVILGFRQMELRDVSVVSRLLRNHLIQFGVVINLDENDIEH